MKEEALRIIWAFVKLLKERNTTFTPAAWQALPQLDGSLAELEANDDISVAEKIIDWSKSYPDLMEVLGKTDRQDIVEDEDEEIHPPSPRGNALIVDNKFLVRETIKAASQQPPPTMQNSSQSHE